MNKLLVEPSRLCSIVSILLASAVFFVSPINGARAQLTNEDRQLLEKINEIQQSNTTKADITYTENSYTESATEEAKVVYKQLEQGVLRDIAQKNGTPANERTGERTIVFASLSLGESALEELLYFASQTDNSEVVFRGVSDVNDIAKSFLIIQSLAKLHEPSAVVTIDPTLFRQYSVTSVPTIIMVSQDDKVLAAVKGLSDPRYLQKRIAMGETGDLGVRGPTEEIAERDLIEVMQEKVAGIDWEQKKAKAIKGYWEHQDYHRLPKATQPRIRQLDPSVQVTRDINDAEGNVIVRAGTIINPLNLRSFTQAVYVFDPLDKEQMALVQKSIASLQETVPRITLIATQFDPDKGWLSYQEVTEAFARPVYKLTKDVLDRFQVEKVPTLITAQNDYFILEELARTPSD